MRIFLGQSAYRIHNFQISAMVFIYLFLAVQIYAQWVDADKTGMGEINISNTPGGSSEAVIAVDGSGNPHCVWREYLSIYYSRWNGSEWVDADGTGLESIQISTGVDGAYNPDIKIDAYGNPHVAWNQNSAGGTDIYYLKWNGTEWVDADGAGRADIIISGSVPGNVSQEPSLQLDTYGNAHIAWSERLSARNEIYYLEWNGSAWVDADGSGSGDYNVSNMSGSNEHPSLSLDSAGNPHIAWDSTELGSDISYLKWNGSAWVDADGTGRESINIANTPYNSYYPLLCLDSSGNPHITWQDGLPAAYNICYLRWNTSAWVDADGSGRESMSTGETGWKPALALDNMSRPHISWAYLPGGVSIEVGYLKWNGSEWVDADGAGRGEKLLDFPSHHTTGYYPGPSLVLDNLNQPHIAWDDDTPGAHDIYYLQWHEPLPPTPTVTPAFALPAAGARRVVVFPNPFSKNNPFDGALKFQNVIPGSEIIIYTVSGEVVWAVNADDIKVKWDGKNRWNKTVSPGIYYYSVRGPETGRYETGKIFVQSIR